MHNVFAAHADCNNGERTRAISHGDLSLLFFPTHRIPRVLPVRYSRACLFVLNRGEIDWHGLRIKTCVRTYLCTHTYTLIGREWEGQCLLISRYPIEISNFHKLFVSELRELYITRIYIRVSQFLQISEDKYYSCGIWLPCTLSGMNWYHTCIYCISPCVLFNCVTKIVLRREKIKK